MKLYYYDHCPFCVRALMMAGYKQVPVERIVLLNDDADTCIRLVQAKQVPILEFDDGTAMPESLDIAHKLNEIGAPNKVVLAQTNSQKTITDHINAAGTAINNLLFPRYVKAGLPEFATQSAIDYFRTKKEKVIGKSFDQALDESASHRKEVEHMLATLPAFSAARDSSIGWDDIMIFPTLRNLTIVKDLLIPATVENYIDKIAQLTGVHLYHDRAL